MSISSGAFGDDTASTVVRNVNCYGNETGVLSCTYSTDDPGICSEHSAAVICQGQKQPVQLVIYIDIRNGICMYVHNILYIFIQISPLNFHYAMMVIYILLVAVPSIRGD